MIVQNGDRDLVGYGHHPPDPQWPRGAGVALNFVLNIEEGSEYAIEHGDGFSEGTLTEMGESPLPRGARDLAAEGMFEYGARVGVWRLLDLFAARNLPLTGFACALALERLPELAAAWRAAGHDICCHGWRWVNHWQLSEAEEREHIGRAVASLKRTVGEAPPGWYCRYGPSLNTRRLVVEHGGFLYDSDAYNDELPYYVAVAGKPHLVLPYTLAANDVKFQRGAGIGNGDDFERLLRDALDLLRAESPRRGGKMMSVGMHARVLGHPARAAGLARFLDYAARLPDVWICRRIDIARHWLATHPPPAA
jgi:peptidoglycan/xylan/chitin deacetylase (PgdA/CDA1 family)